MMVPLEREMLPTEAVEGTERQTLFSESRRESRHQSQCHFDIVKSIQHVLYGLALRLYSSGLGML